MADSEIEIIPPSKSGKGRRPKSPGDDIWRILYVVAAIIIVIWLIGLFLRAAFWLVGALLPLAVLIIIVGLLYRHLSHR